MSITKSSSKGNIDKSLNNSITLDLSNHNLNNSSSKQKFSFPKASRFNLTKSICDSFYDVPTTKNGRSTSFGYGMKDMGIRNNRYAPEPGSYNIQSEFQSSKKQRRGTSFGPGREQMEIGGPLKDSIARKYIPGPGNYNTSYTTLDNRHMTIKSRLADKSQNHLLKNPGPGTYNLQELGSKDYVTSKYKNWTHLAKISPSSGHKQLISTKTIDVVGPGQYNQTERAMNAEGKYFLSKNKNSGSRQFSKSPRQSLVYKHLLQTPGPMRQQQINNKASISVNSVPDLISDFSISSQKNHEFSIYLNASIFFMLNSSSTKHQLERYVQLRKLKCCTFFVGEIKQLDLVMNTYYKSGSRRQKRVSLHSRGSALQNNRPNKIGHNEKLKIEDEQPLFVSNRRNVSTAQNYREQNNEELMFTSNVIHKKQPTSRFSQTAKQGFRKNQQRPESKQQPRNKGWNNSGMLLKTPIIENNRPQTSKGQRPKISYRQKPDDISKRRASLEGEDFRVEKRPYPIATSSSTRRGNNTARLEFKTSIDPEFLSLFAS